MARKKGGVLGSVEQSSPVYDGVGPPKGTATSVTTTAEAIPATNLSGRKGILIQNLTATANYVYIGGNCRPDILACPSGFYKTIVGTKKALKWTLSTGGGTTEYYAELAGTAGGDPGLSEPLRMYGVTSSGGSESKLTNGTAGALNNLEWDWGDADSLGYNTVYFRLNAGDPDSTTVAAYLTLMSYISLPDASSNYGYRLGAGNAVYLPVSGAHRLFAISSSGTQICSHLEFE